MKKYQVIKGIEVVFEGTNEDYVRLCDIEGFETSGDIWEDRYNNNFYFGDSSDYKLEEVDNEN